MKTLRHFLLLIAVPGLLAAFPAAAQAPNEGAGKMRQLAGERGCTLCHREAPPPPGADAGTPLAPSWSEIAARYKGQATAEKRLVRIVLLGADPAQRHWKNRHEFTSMGGNAPRVSAGEARALVRWILATP